ncbi:hypothetical protein TSAR_007085 [Trichomalopsis sarcophagae]|uniref:Uncharacterized protein n=1 Tax=Trichomalopsis sarcophagae TaxID=543379 RepID=A0A232ERX5_9HYME|nr:hypothetical protein TSAR_007085 [Trichomalopsis sarcophagae]
MKITNQKKKEIQDQFKNGLRFNEHLLYRFKVIMTVISSNCLVNNEAFGAYCKETAFKYVELYNWYKMPTSMHVMEELILPIGMLSEEAQENNHKTIKRVATNTDMFCRLFINSDPYLSLLDIEENKKKLNDSGDEKSPVAKLMNCLEHSYNNYRGTKHQNKEVIVGKNCFLMSIIY